MKKPIPQNIKEKIRLSHEKCREGMKAHWVFDDENDTRYWVTLWGVTDIEGPMGATPTIEEANVFLD